jgi:hypothetical protein
VAVASLRAVVIEPATVNPGTGDGEAVGVGVGVGPIIGVGPTVGDPTDGPGEQPASATATSKPVMAR